MLTFPFILVGLIVLGLPAAYLLRRGKLESALSYAAAGGLGGAIWGGILGFQTTYGSAVSAFYGVTCALFWWVLRSRA
ncbi:MAG TPA: hypothetical protein VFO69_08035 [Allosphingosinicella sp.]|nr:hypothetical protein [Allosphingosinicella sp.]